jgi:hypothetical protein
MIRPGEASKYPKEGILPGSTGIGEGAQSSHAKCSKKAEVSFASIKMHALAFAGSSLDACVHSLGGGSPVGCCCCCHVKRANSGHDCQRLDETAARNSRGICCVPLCGSSLCGGGGGDAFAHGICGGSGRGDGGLAGPPALVCGHGGFHAGQSSTSCSEPLMRSFLRLV